MLKKLIFLSIFICISLLTIKAFETTNTNNRSSHARPQVPILNLARVQRNVQQQAHRRRRRRNPRTASTNCIIL